MARVQALGVARSYMKAETFLPFPDGATVDELLQHLPDQIREMVAKREVCILIDGVDSSARDGLRTRIEDGSTVTIIPFAHGGSLL